MGELALRNTLGLQFTRLELPRLPSSRCSVSRDTFAPRPAARPSSRAGRRALVEDSSFCRFCRWFCLRICARYGGVGSGDLEGSEEEFLPAAERVSRPCYSEFAAARTCVGCPFVLCAHGGRATLSRGRRDDPLCQADCSFALPQRTGSRSFLPGLGAFRGAGSGLVRSCRYRCTSRSRVASSRARRARRTWCCGSCVSCTGSRVKLRRPR